MKAPKNNRDYAIEYFDHFVGEYHTIATCIHDDSETGFHWVKASDGEIIDPCFVRGFPELLD